MNEVLMELDSCETERMLSYADFELECPFCECSHLSVEVGSAGTEYTCSNCGGEWNVLER